MDNENGTAVVVAAAAAAVATTKVDEPKVAEITASTKTDAIDTSIVETVKNAEVSNLNAKLVEAAIKPDESKALKSKSTSNEETTTAAAVPAEVSKTTTTVTVNVTQTKVTVDGDVVDKGIGEVVSTVSSIAGAAVDAIAHELKKPIETAEANSVDNDVDMIDADAITDCEMKDVSLVEEQPQIVTTTTASTTANAASAKKSVEADSVNSVTAAVESTVTQNEAEQKIAAVDDVEKNISNLFNGGDDNVVSTNDKSGDDPSKDEQSSTQIASSQSSSLNNGTDNVSAKDTKSRHDAIKDNNDLVSILAGNDKPEENISSSSALKPTVSSEKDAKSVVSTKSQITSSSSSGSKSSPSKSTTAQSSVLNKSTASPTTTTQKQSEVTSGKVVSTASEPVAVDAEKGLGGKASRQELVSSLSSTIKEDSSLALSSTVSGSEASSDNLKKRTNLNGLSDEADAAVVGVPKEGSTKIDSSVSATPKTPITPKVLPEQSIFNINICYENTELVSFNVEKQGTNKVDTTQNNSSTPSSSETAPQKTQQELKGTVALCTFIIDHFEKLRTKLTGNVDTQKTPATSGRGRGKSATNVEPTTPSVTSTASKRKRGPTAALESPATLNDSVDSEAQPKSAKKAKKEPATPKTPAAESEYPEKAVLARWVDKKFYAGRVIEQKPNNKFVVLFEDGAKKTLPEDHIVFGKENNILPLVNESVHALVGNETYEPGNVQSVETKDDGGVYYTVACESQTVTVTASDIYLEEEQAKVILSKHASNNPEPGFSGGLNTRKDRRNKRAESNRHVQWFSESDVSDINESDSRPASPPVTVLEAVDGVQPELQHTQKESELVRICYLMERFGDDFRKVNLDNVLGPIIKSNILKNKSFLLTCTIPIKTTATTNGTTNGTANERQNVRSNGYDLNSKNTVFSTTPFFKDHLKQQIEAAGGIVYSNFENIPSNKYRTCFLLAPFPCITAKYVQCLAANIMAVSHEWIVECCQRNKLLNKDDFVLPSGWSIIESRYKPWSMGRGRDQRKNAFSKTTIIITSQQSDFVEFWSRVCKSAGAKIRLVKSTVDLTATTKGYILLDDEFPPEIQNRAERFHIPIVSTVWVIQSLIHGKICDPNAHPKLTQLYEDDYF